MMGAESFCDIKNGFDKKKVDRPKSQSENRSKSNEEDRRLQKKAHRKHKRVTEA